MTLLWGYLRGCRGLILLRLKESPTVVKVMITKVRMYMMHVNFVPMKVLGDKVHVDANQCRVRTG